MKGIIILPDGSCEELETNGKSMKDILECEQYALAPADNRFKFEGYNMGIYFNLDKINNSDEKENNIASYISNEKIYGKCFLTDEYLDLTRDLIPKLMDMRHSFENLSKEKKQELEKFMELLEQAQNDFSNKMLNTPDMFDENGNINKDKFMEQIQNLKKENTKEEKKVRKIRKKVEKKPSPEEVDKIREIAGMPPLEKDED